MRLRLAPLIPDSYDKCKQACYSAHPAGSEARQECVWKCYVTWIK